jgi:aminomethyltransferase
VTARSPLHATHERLGARFTEFGGWEMPLQYEGTLAEHRAVRESVGVFDVSHLGRFSLTGPGAHPALSRLLCNDIELISPGHAQYTMLLTEGGGVVDDVIVWWLDDQRYVVLPNGVNHDIVLFRFREEVAEQGECCDLRPETALIAVQGPDAPELVHQVLGAMPGRFKVIEPDVGVASAVAAGTGYTGERGAEIMIDAAHADDLFSRILQAGATPCGLGARDTLRLEMGYLLWGQDLDVTTTPLEAGHEWVVGWDHDFVGRTALERERATGVGRCLIGFALEERRVPRHGYRLRCGDAFGAVTSGNFSPTLGVGIGMGYVAPDPGATTSASVEVRGDWIAARRVHPPFVER